MSKDVIPKVRKIVEKSGLTYQEIGVRMLYPKSSARQSVSQFLKGKNPTVAMLQRFAKAMKIDVKELL